MYLGSATAPGVGPIILSLTSRSLTTARPPGLRVDQEPIVDHSLEWLMGVFRDMWALILRVVEVVVSWVGQVGVSLPMRLFEALCQAYTFGESFVSLAHVILKHHTLILKTKADFISFFTFLVETHPHPFHILGWSIFFGPIIILIPCLLLIELLVLVLFQLSFVSHGVSFSFKFPPASGSLPDRFDALREYFMEWRESLFANVELWTAVFNKWTVDYPPLLVLRLAAGAMSLFILFGLWSTAT